jgi:ABC-type nickel/cobalt efflux system permease component RcnA
MSTPAIAGPLVVAALLGLRHALDPDHLVAVSTLVATVEERAARVAGRLGVAWGVGHALTVVLLGLPVVLAHAVLPDVVQRLAETAIGLIIVVLAGRLLLRWRGSAYHLHAHEHAGTRHTHVHPHRGERGHEHAHVVPRTPLQAFLIGATHGVGGSAPVAVLLLASVPGRASAAAALGVFAAGTAVSMAVLSSTFGWMLGSRHVRQRLRLAAVPLSVAGLAFGALYAAAAWLPALAPV